MRQGLETQNLRWKGINVLAGRLSLQCYPKDSGESGKGWDGVGMAQDLEAAMPSSVTLRRWACGGASCNHIQV